MSGRALTAVTPRLGTHVPGQGTRGGNHVSQNHHQHRSSHLPHLSSRDAPSLATNALGPCAASHHARHNPNEPHPRCRRLKHHTILLPPAAIRHVLSHHEALGVPCVSCAAASAAAALAAVGVGVGPSDRGRRLVTRARAPWGAKEIDDNALGGNEGGDSDADGTPDRDRRARSSDDSQTSVSQSDAFDAAYVSYSDDVDGEDCASDFCEFSDARVPSWVTLTRRRWSQVTMSAASAATVPFLFLTMPQIVKNASLVAAGRPDALAAIAWQGQVAGLLGNLLLLSYFTDKGELSASVVQGVGVCTTAALLTQVTFAGHIPAGPFLIGAAAVICGVSISLARLLGKCGPVDENGSPVVPCVDSVPCVGNVQCDLRFGSMDDDKTRADSKLDITSSEKNTRRLLQTMKRLFDDFGNTIWSVYQGILGVVGLAALPQVGLQSLLPEELVLKIGFVPGIVGGSLGVVLLVLGRLKLLPPALATAWGRLSGWTATLLFMTMPVAQLASNFARPATLEGLSGTALGLSQIPPTVCPYSYQKGRLTSNCLRNTHHDRLTVLFSNQCGRRCSPCWATP